MYGFQYDYVKPKYDDNAKLYYMDTDSFTVQVKTNDIYKDIADVETRFGTILNQTHHCLKEKIKKVI